MPRILITTIFFFCVPLTIEAQIYLTPTSLSWYSNETAGKTVTVHSGGRWDTDSLNLGGHFVLSRYSGGDGTVVSVYPSGANTGGTAITENICFRHGNETSYLQLVHTATPLTLGASPSSISWGYAATDVNTISISCNSNWSASTDADWVNLSTPSGEGNGSISVNPRTENPCSGSRSAAVSVHCGPLTKTVLLTQQGNSSASGLAVAPPSLRWDAEDDGMKYVTVASGGRWTVDSLSSWPIYFHITRQSGSDGSVIGIKPVGKNRSDIDIAEAITFIQGTDTVRMQLSQGCWRDTFSASPACLTWGAADNGLKTVSVNCPSGWSAHVSGSGFEISAGSGSGIGAGVISVSASAVNLSPEPIERFLVITGEGGGVNRLVRLIQEGTSGGFIGGAGGVEFREGESLQDYYPGESIPYRKSAGQQGAVVYSVPVATAAGMKHVPHLSLTYNSLGGNGPAGYGWTLGGLSGITVCNKTAYYDGAVSPADADSPDAAYSLDGVRMVRTNRGDALEEWQYETVTGHVLVRKHVDAQGRALWFDALYPDGSRAAFGSSSAASPSVEYPVREYQDREGNWIRYNYAADSVYTDSVRPTLIEYGLPGSMAATGRISMSYASRSDHCGRHLCGRTLGSSSILKSITSLDGADTLRRYGLEHAPSAGIQMLTRISCRTQGCSAETAPLRFRYGVEGTSEASCWNEDDAALLGRAFPDAGKLVTIRGKFMPGIYDDGLIVYPEMNIYPDDQTILVFPSPTGNPLKVDRMKTDSSFDGIFAADTDGDGTDEVVKVRRMFLLTTETFRYTVQGYDVSGTLSAPRTVDILAGHYGTFAQYRFGDYMGTGRNQIAAIQYEYNANSGDYSLRVVLADLREEVKIHEGVLFSGTVDDPRKVFSSDVDGDGVHELCLLTAGGLELWNANPATGAFSLRKTVTGISDYMISYGSRIYQTDLNADGYLDLAFSPLPESARWSIYQFDGIRFRNSSVNIVQDTPSAEYLFIDLDRDGLQDLVRRYATQVSVWFNRNGTLGQAMFDAPAGLSSAGSALVPCNAVRRGSASSLLVLDTFQVKRISYGPFFPELHLLTESAGSLGEYAHYGYRYAADGISGSLPDYVPDAGNGYIRQPLPAYLVVMEEERESKRSPTHIAERGYAYRGSVANTRGLGWCGFRKTETEERKGPDTGTGTVDIYRAVRVWDPEKCGLPVSDTLYVNGTEASRTEYVSDSHTGVNGLPDPRLVSSAGRDALTGVETVSSFTYDNACGLPTMVSVTRSLPGGTGVPEVTETTYAHSLVPSLYLLGATACETRTKGAASWKTEYTLDSLLRPVRIRKYSGQASGATSTIQWAQSSEQRLAYGPGGTVARDSTASYGASVFNVNSYTYSQDGRFVTGSTDAMGRTTLYPTRDRYGNAVLVTDWLGRSETHSYDVWGAPVRTESPDGAVAQETRGWSASGEPGVVRVMKTSSGELRGRVWLDAYGRELRSASRRFDGSWLFTDKEYDTRGRVKRVSLPYRDTTVGPLLWNTYSYDAFDRKVALAEADGRQTLWSYAGRTTTETRDGVASTSATDAEGRVVSVTDAGGTVSYALRDDGLPDSVTVTPAGAQTGVVTSFLYDIHGRRTSITDPSAGVRTDAYTDNADGSSSVAHTGPSGTVTTYRDRHGRTTAVTRPEFNTSYTYGTALGSSSYGLLLSETSTNGTGKSISYDALGRISTETEYADASHSLTKTYTYVLSGPDAGNVASVTYATQDGTVTTESSTYSFGHRTATSAARPGGGTAINVFTITAENAMGLPASACTGTAQRSYTYTAAGRPSTRTILDGDCGTVQHFGYAYNPSTGNMTFRTDGVLEYREDFTYDALNRLLTAHQGPTSDGYPPEYDYSHADAAFDSKGNVEYRDNDGTLECFMEYNDQTDPYKVTGNYAMGDILPYTPEYGAVSMTSFDRPGGISSAAGMPATTVFTYNADGERTRMGRDEAGRGMEMDRYYLGGVYEKDDWRDGVTDDTERLFLGGSAYSAPMVLVRTPGINGGTWTPFSIGRDVQGSITEVLTEDGTVVETFRYDPWGLMVNASVPEPEYDPDLDPDLYPDIVPVDSLPPLNRWQWAGRSVYVGGHGYTGHEHLPGWGLINANARLYDPALARFLSPDPLVQDPAGTQNFNRYSYCLNNPLKYTDESGEFFGAMLGLVSDLFNNVFVRTPEWKKWDWSQTKLGWELDKSLFYTDENKGPAGRIWEFVSRLTWQLPQTTVGYLTVISANAFGAVNGVSHNNGMTAVDMGLDDGKAVTIGFYSVGPKGYKADWRDHLFVHEYGHYIQSQQHGPVFLLTIGIPSFQSAILQTDNPDSPLHRNRWFEADANYKGANYFDKYYGSGKEGYEKGRDDYFDIDSFKFGRESPYLNPRTKKKNESAHNMTSTFHITDIAIYIPLIGLIPYFFY